MAGDPLATLLRSLALCSVLVSCTETEQCKDKLFNPTEYYMMQCEHIRHELVTFEIAGKPWVQCKCKARP
jgi:hypothetical protein